MTKHIMTPFLLDKTSKVNIRLDSNMNFLGDGWKCGLKTFSIDKNWSLINDVMTVIYTNGYKTIIKPKQTHSVKKITNVLDEMLGKNRSKRDLIDDLTFNDESSDEEKEEEKKPKQVLPPPSLFPLEPAKTEKNDTKGPTKEVIPPPSIVPLMPSPKKPEITDDRMKVVTFPTDEEGKTGNKYYIVYKKLNDAYYYSPELPPNFNNFCKTAFNSIKFTLDSTNNRYEVDFDSEYIRAIHLSNGFSRVLGFNEVIFKGGIAPNPPAVETFHSHILVCLKDIIYPINFGSFKDGILGVISVSSGPDPVSVVYGQPTYSGISLNSISEIEIELKDIHGNPIFGDNATGHFTLEFVKHSKTHY